MTKKTTRPQGSGGSRGMGATRGHGAKTAAVRERAILALLSERTIDAAAHKAGVSERTVRRWMTEDAAFKADLVAARTATFQGGLARVQALFTKGIDTLEDLLRAKKFPAVQLGSARTIVEVGLHAHDSEVIMAKLDDVERAQRAAAQRDRR